MVKSPKSATDLDKTVGKRVRVARLAAAITQEQLGAKLGVTFQQIQKYEKGVNRISTGRVQIIAKALNVPMSFFFEESFDAVPAFYDDVMKTPEGMAMNKAFLQVKDKAVRRSLVSLIEKLAG